VEILAEELAERGLKHSRQRDLIVEVFFATGGHLPVEALVARVHEQDPRVSVATVYRTMKLLVECGLADARDFGDGQTRYEPAMQRDHHDHLICTHCGAIHEFESERIEELQERVARRHGFEVEHHRLEIYGRCGECRAATKESRA
jgi:Fur family ferric uptake transcriptional regulator